MIVENQLMGRGILLRQIELSDCTQSYVDWLNDPEVNRFLETRWNVQDASSIKDFVIAQRKDERSALFAIVDSTCERPQHVGNIKIGPIDWRYGHADISYFIGEKECWGRGIATEAISLICRYGFMELDLHRLEAGAYAAAAGSWKALEKNGFIREGVFREQIVSGGKRMDVYRYGLLKSEYGRS